VLGRRVPGDGRRDASSSPPDESRKEMRRDELYPDTRRAANRQARGLTMK